MFDEGARQLHWHYQWIVLNEFLPALVGETLVDQQTGCLRSQLNLRDEESTNHQSEISSVSSEARHDLVLQHAVAPLPRNHKG